MLLILDGRARNYVPVVFLENRAGIPTYFPEYLQGREFEIRTEFGLLVYRSLTQSDSLRECDPPPSAAICFGHSHDFLSSQVTSRRNHITIQ